MYEDKERVLFLKIKFFYKVKTADIVVACLGKPKFVQGSWLKENAVVIDCGITPVQGISILVFVF